MSNVLALTASSFPGLLPPRVPRSSLLVVAFFAVLLVGLAKGGFSGIGMAATPLLALTMPPLQALAILLPILLMQDAISVWWYRHDWDGWNVKVMLPGAVVGVALAWTLASVVPDDAVRLLIGVIGVSFVLNMWFGRMPPPRPAERRERLLLGRGFRIHLHHRVGRDAAVLRPRAAAANGQARLVGTVTMFFAAVNLMRLVPYYGLGQLTRERS